MRFGKWLRKFKADLKASGKIMAGAVLGLVIDIYIIAYTMPDALTAMANGTAWVNTGTAVSTLATVVMPIVVIGGLIYMILKSVGVTD